jgi:hypothetical protein
MDMKSRETRRNKKKWKLATEEESVFGFLKLESMIE